jgi:hypothetical protein
VMGERSCKKELRGCTKHDGAISSPEPPGMNGLRCQSKSGHLF